MQEMKWISAKERLPRNLDDVLALYENGNMEVSCRYSDGWLMERKWGARHPLDAATLMLTGGNDRDN